MRDFQGKSFYYLPQAVELKLHGVVFAVTQGRIEWVASCPCMKYKWPAGQRQGPD